MNYNDEILINKPLQFIKKLFYNIVIAVCILLGFALICIYALQYKPYEVLSNSMSPVFYRGDMVVVKSQKQYKVGDIIKYNVGGLAVSHRLIAIVTNGGTTYYVMHGDATGRLDDSNSTDWHKDVEFVKDKSYNEIKSLNVDCVTKNNIEGKVMFSLSKFGTYLTFANNHKFMIIAAIFAVWSVIYCLDNESEIYTSRRVVNQ